MYPCIHENIIRVIVFCVEPRPGMALELIALHCCAPAPAKANSAVAVGANKRYVDAASAAPLMPYHHLFMTRTPLMLQNIRCAGLHFSEYFRRYKSSPFSSFVRTWRACTSPVTRSIVPPMLVFMPSLDLEPWKLMSTSST